MTNLTLAQRVLTTLGKIVERSDTSVAVWGNAESLRTGTWEKTLPADMFAFIRGLNGLALRYTMLGSEGYHGPEFRALYEDGRQVMSPHMGNNFSLPRQRAGSYPDGFFAGTDLSPDDMVLLFYVDDYEPGGDNPSSGILMVHEGEDAEFYWWRKGELLEKLPGSFTEIIERGIEAGFARGWPGSDRPAADAVIAKLGEDVAPRMLFELEVESLEVLENQDYRRLLGAQLQARKFDGVMKALGRDERAEGLSQDQRGELIAECIADPGDFSAADAKKIMSALYAAKKTKKALVETFRLDHEPLAWARVRVRTLPAILTHTPEDFRAPGDNDWTLARVLHGIEGLHVTDDYPGHPDLLAYTSPMKADVEYKAYLKSEWTVDDERCKEFKPKTYQVNSSGEKYSGVEALFQVLITETQAQGLEEGAIYESPALPEWIA